MQQFPGEPVLLTAGEDCLFKIWDCRAYTPLVATVEAHRNAINGLRLGADSHSLCTVSADLTVKNWDVRERALIDTYY